MAYEFWNRPVFLFDYASGQADGEPGVAGQLGMLHDGRPIDGEPVLHEDLSAFARPSDVTVDAVRGHV
jgi:hypothetical protein